MNAREIESAAEQLVELRRKARDRAVLGFAALGAAVAASLLVPALGVPLLVGGSFLIGRSLVDAVRRWELLDALAADPAAHVIEPVRRQAERLARAEVRHDVALTIRLELAQPSPSRGVALCRPELEELAARLDGDDWELDPATAAACHALIDDPASLLRDCSTAPELVRSKVLQLLDGLHRIDGPGGGVPPAVHV